MSVQQTKMKAIADAIREKDGTTGPIPANDFPDRIRAIPSGGLPEGMHTITLETSDPQMGAVSGGGIVQDGVSVAAVASAFDGFKLTSWQESGNIVSEKKEYIFSASENRTLTAIFENSVNLPDGYTLVQYVTSDNNFATTSYPAIIPINLLRIELEVSFIAFYSTYYYIFRSRVGTTTYSGLQRASGGKWYLSLEGSPISITDSSVTTGDLAHIVLDVPERKFFINDIEYLYNPASVSSQEAWIYIGGTSTSTSKQNNSQPMKIYDVKFYKGNDLVSHVVPCVNPSGNAALYDVVQKVEIQHASTLTPGPAV